MGRIWLLLIVIVVLAVSCAREEEHLALALEHEIQRVAGADTLWPGYDPLAIPLAVFDGTDTYLFRHPVPPEDFHEEDGAYVLAGRHPAIEANASATIGDVRTATLILEPPLAELALRDMAAVALHEAFHVFQFATERRWGADETYLFTYPVEDADLLGLRRLETEALRRAFEATDGGSVAAWSRLALDLRRERFGLMDAPFSAYERGIEGLEGTATYIEYKAAGRMHPDFPSEGFSPDNVRGRAYTTGVAFALLLDRFDPGWRDGFDADDRRHLDMVLEDALGTVGEPAGAAFASSEVAEIARVAEADIEALLGRRREMREEFEAASGLQLVIDAHEAPLWPQGFDPMNVHGVEGGLLHTRFLRLGNELGRLEVMGDTVLTEGIGPHPLFNGVKRVVVAGLPSGTTIDTTGEHVLLNLSTFSMDFQHAAVERREGKVYLRLGSE